MKLRRTSDGQLGISIKGGRDHNLPILVSKVCRFEEDDHLYIGDAIVKVNDNFLTSVTHDEAINILRNAGSEVTLTVKHYKSAAPFLLKNVRQFIPDVDQASSTPLGKKIHNVWESLKSFNFGAKKNCEKQNKISHFGVKSQKMRHLW